MLVLSRRVGERVRIGADVVVEVVAVKGERITLGIVAPREVGVLREELVEAVAAQNAVAARDAAGALRAVREALGVAKTSGETPTRAETAPGTGAAPGDRPKPRAC